MADSQPTLTIAAVLLRQRRLLVVLPLALAVGAGVISLLSRGYVAESKFLPQKSELDVSRFTGVAATLGIPLGTTSSSGESVDFYAALLKSREILLEAGLTEYRFATTRGGRDTISGTLPEIFEIRAPTHDRVRMAAIGLMDAAVTVRIDGRANLVFLRTVAPYAELAEQINGRLLQLVNDFNLSKRQSQGGAERRFLEQRLADAESALREVEEALRQFVDRNRRYQDSPELVLEYNRLQRLVTLRQQVFLNLSQTFEQSRLTEVRNTPLITVVQRPALSAQRNVRLRLNVALGGMLGFFLAVGVALVREQLARHQEGHPDQYEEVRQLFRQTLADLTPRRRRARRVS